MNPLKRLFKQTFIYGLATVLPRMLSFILVMVHTDAMLPREYGEVSIVFSWFAIFNVLLAYGMETAFFRFFHKESSEKKVVSTALVSILITSIGFLVTALWFKLKVSEFLEIRNALLPYVAIILFVDALTIIPFARMRALERPMRYAVIKVLSVGINLFFNLFFLVFLPKWVQEKPSSYWAKIFMSDFQVEYILTANILASMFTLFCVGGLYFEIKYRFDKLLWKKMMRYALPIMVAGIAFTINEVFDRILLKKLLPEDIAQTEIGKYSACYKLAAFMTLFGTAFRLGVEPFFFSHAKEETPQKTYAQITTYFVILGGTIFLTVLAFIEPLKKLLVRNETFWEAMGIVPILLLASFCLGIYHNLSVWYKITDNTRFGAYISCLGALITLVVNFLFIPFAGYMASAWATLAAYSSMMLASYYFGRKYYPIPYNLRNIAFYSSLSVLFGLLSFYVFNGNLMAGTLFLLVFLMLIYKLEGDNIKTIFLKRED